MSALQALNIAIIAVTVENLGAASGYCATRVDRSDMTPLFFSKSDFEALLDELYDGSDLVITIIPEVVKRLEIARFPYQAAL